jgi:hypothetical protein
VIFLVVGHNADDAAGRREELKTSHGFVTCSVGYDVVVDLAKVMAFLEGHINKVGTSEKHLIAARTAAVGNLFAPHEKRRLCRWF